MTSSFLPDFWRQASAGIDLAKTIELRALAFRAKELGHSRDVTEFFAVLDEARNLINELQTKSRVSFFWPSLSSRSNIYHWLKGLASYAELPGLKPQTPPPTQH